MIPDNWSEAWPGGMLTNPSIAGGIIDTNRISNTWFVIFNDDRPSMEGLPDRATAIQAFFSA